MPKSNLLALVSSFPLAAFPNVEKTLISLLFEFCEGVFCLHLP